MTFGTRSTGSTSNQCQNVTIHNVSTIKLTKSLNARASADDDRKDTDLSSQAEVDTVEEAESSEAPAAREGSGSPGTEAAEQDLKQDSDGDEETSQDQEGDTDSATGKGDGSEEASDIGPHDASGTEAEADVLVLAAAPGRDGAEAPEILLEGLEPPSSTALEGLDINALVTLLPALGFSGAQDSVVRLPSSAVTAQGYRGPATILVVGVGTGWADTDPLAVTTDDEAALGTTRPVSCAEPPDAPPEHWPGPTPRSWHCPRSARSSSPPSRTEPPWARTPGARRRTRTAPGRRRPRRRPPRSQPSPSSPPWPTPPRGRRRWRELWRWPRPRH